MKFHSWLVAVLLWSMTGFAIAADFNHAPWDQLLKKHVVVLQEGLVSQVNYVGMAADKSPFQAYLRSVSSVTKSEFDSWPVEHQLAFLINSYNAWTIDLVLSAYPKLDSIKDLGSLFRSPWKKEFISLFGETRSLDGIEHGLIRGSGRYNDPRIHFAVNCASIGCPALRAEAYSGDRIERQLDDATRNFLADRMRNRLNADVLEVSSIFKWYRGDFDKGWRNRKNLAYFLASYGPALGLDKQQIVRVKSGDIALDFLDYDWRLNDVTVVTQ